MHSRFTDRIRGLLAKYEQPAPSATDSIVRDSFANRLVDDAFVQMPAVAKLARDLNHEFDHTDELVKDLLIAAYSEAPELRPESEMSTSHRLNRAVVESIQDTDEWQRQRAFTIHDKYSSALTTLSVSKSVESTLRSRSDEMREAEEMAERAKEAAKEAAERAAEMAKQAQDAADEAAANPEDEAAATTAAAADEAADEAVTEAEAAAQDANTSEAHATSVAQAIAAAASGSAAEAAEAAREQSQNEQASAKAWGVGSGELRSMSFQERARLANAMRSNRMSEFADLIGRFRMHSAAMQAKKSPEGRDEVVGVHLSSDLDQVLASELVNLATGIDVLELDFIRRFGEGQLLSRKTVGHEKVGRGPIICCVDVSGSMDSGTPTFEAWAKAVALSLLDEAKRLNRDFIGILYDGAVRKVIELTKGRGDVFEVIEWASYFSGGGTDFDGPLQRSLDYFHDTTFRGDVVFITDGVGHLSDETVEAWNAMRTKTGARCFGVLLNDPDNYYHERALAALARFCNNVRSIEDTTSNGSLDDIYRALEK